MSTARVEDASSPTRVRGARNSSIERVQGVESTPKRLPRNRVALARCSQDNAISRPGSRPMARLNQVSGQSPKQVLVPRSKWLTRGPRARLETQKSLASFADERHSARWPSSPVVEVRVNFETSSPFRPRTLAQKDTHRSVQSRLVGKGSETTIRELQRRQTRRWAKVEFGRRPPKTISRSPWKVRGSVD
jgi:hypothetical protein